MEQKSFHLHHYPRAGQRQERPRERREDWWNEALADVTPKSTPHPKLPRRVDPATESRAPQAKSSSAMAQRPETGTFKDAVVRLAKRLQHWLADIREQRRAYRQLTAMSDRELQDMGLNRGDIDTIIDGSLPHDPTRIRNVNVVRHKPK